MADYTIHLGVTVDADGLQSQINTAASNLKPINLNVQLNTRDIESQINGIRQQLQSLNNIGINLGGFGGGNGGRGVRRQVDETTQAYTRLTRVLNELGSKRIKLSGLDTLKKPQLAQSLASDIQQLERQYNNMWDSITRRGIQFTAEQQSRIRTLIDKTNRQIVNNQSTLNDKGALENRTRGYERLLSMLKQIGTLEQNVTKLRNQGGNTSQISELESQLNSLRATYLQLLEAMQMSITPNQWASLDSEVAKTENRIAALQAKFRDTRADLARDINIKLASGTFDNEISNITSKFDKIKNKSAEIRTAMNEVNVSMANMRTAAASGNIDDLINANQRYERSLKALKNQIDINARAERDAAAAQKLADDRAVFQSKIDTWLAKNSAAVKKFGASMMELRAQAESCDSVTLDHLKSQFDQLDNQAGALGLKMQSFGDRIKTQFQKYSQYFSVASVIMYTRRALTDMFRQVVSIDTAMTELKKVTDETDVTYDRFLSNSASRAKKLGTTIDGLVNSTADFARLGYSFEESQGLAEVANIYAVVGDEIDGVETATQSLVSTLAAFKHEMGDMSDSEFAMSIVDKFNEVSNNFAISSGGIGEALQRSASSLATANNTLDESIALITAANTVAQNPEKVGNAFKTISMRIRGAKSELEEAGESTDGMVESTAKLREEILALSGVDIMKDENTFKSTYAIMDELANKWEDLSDIAQATIIELIAGKHQGNIMSSLMANFDTARKVLETSANSSGSAMAEHAKWSDSLQARLNKLKATWQSLSQTFMGSGFLKGVLGGVTGFVDGIDKLTSKVGVIPTLLGAFSAFKSFSGKGFFKVIEDEAKLSGKRIGNIFSTSMSDVSKHFNNMGIRTNSNFRNQLNYDIKALSAYRNAVVNGMSLTDAFNAHMVNASESAKAYAKNNNASNISVLKFGKQQKSANVTMIALNKSLSSAKAIIQEYNSGCKNTAMSQKDFVAAVGQGNPVLGKYLSGVQAGKAGIVGYAASLTLATVKTFALQAATMALNMALTMGIAALVSWGIKALDEWIVTADELAEKVDEVTSKYKEQHKALMNAKGDYNTKNEDSMISKYAELSKGIDEFGENLSLTSEEYSEYKNIVGEIANQIPSLVEGYNSQGDAILSCKGNIASLVAEYERLIKAQNDEVLIGENARDIEKDFKNEIKKSENISLLNNKLIEKDAKALKEILNSGARSAEEVGKIINENVAFRSDIANVLEDYGLENDLNLFSTSAEYDKFIADAVKNHPEIVKSVVGDFYDTLEAEAEGVKSQAAAALSDAFDISDSKYAGMSKGMQNLAYKIVGGFDAKKYSNILKDGTVEEYINGMLDGFKKLEESGGSAKLEAAFELKTKFNGGEISYGEYVDGINEAVSFINDIDGLNGDVKNQIKTTLNTKEVIDNYNALKTRLTSDEFGIQLSTEKAEAFLNDLTASEYAVAIDLIMNGGIDLKNIDAEKLRAEIERQAKIKEALNFSANIEVDKTSLEAFNTALSESVSAMGLTSESISSLKSKYKDLEGYDPATLFEATANGVKVNHDELVKLEKKYRDLNKSKVQKHLETLVNEYNRLTAEIDKNSNASKRAQLISEREGYYSKIQELAQYQAQLEGVTGAYQRWIDAQSISEDYEGYGAVAQGRKTVEDELKRGFLGNASKEYIDLLSGKDLIGASVDEYIAAWNKLDDKVGSTEYSINDFFSIDDEGNITSKGINNFFDGIQKDFKGSVAKFNEESKEWTYDFSHENLQKIQKEWGIGIEAIGLLLEAAAAAGYDVDWDGILDGIDLDTSNFETLVEYAEAAQTAFNKLKIDGVKGVDFNFKTTNIEDAKSELEKAQSIYKDLTTKDDGSIDINAKGAEQMRVILAALMQQKQQLERPAIMDIEVPFKEANTNIGKATKAVQNLQDNLWKLEQSTYDPDINSAEISGEIGKILSELSVLEQSDPEIYAKLGLDDSQIANLKAAIGNIQANIKAGIEPSQEDIATVQSAIQGIDATVVANYLSGEQEKPDDEPAKVNYELGKQAPPEDKSAKVNYKRGTQAPPLAMTALVNYDTAEVNGTANVNGTAFASGTADESGRAFKNGDWGTKNSGVALMGELGRETIVRDGRFFTVGDNGAGFYKYKRGDIIFNHKQTEELFKYGKVTSGGGRGKAFATGTAFAHAIGADVVGSSKTVNALKKASEALAGIEKLNDLFGIDYNNPLTKSNKTSKETTKGWEASVNGNPINPNTGKTPKNKGGGSGGDSKKKNEFEETFDWIEVKIDRIERAIDKLDLKANSTYKNWSTRNKAIVDEIDMVRDEIDLQQKAYDRYIQEANSVGLSEDLAKKVRDGKIDIETITDEELAEKVKKYQEWYNKALDCKDAIVELRDTEAKLYKQKFDNIVTKYEAQLGDIEDKISMINQDIEQAQYTSVVGNNKNRYKQLISQEEKNISKLESEKKDLQLELDKAVADGIIAKHSEDWYAMMDEIDAVTLAIKESTTNISQYYSDMFDDVIAKYEGILQGYEHTETMLSEYISQAEEKGYITSKEYYQALIDNEKSNISELQKEQDNLIAAREEAVASGKISKNSKEWYEMCEEIDSVTQAIEESTTALIEYDNAMRDIDWQIFDLTQERISDVAKEADFLIDLMSNKKLFDDDGKLTSQGLATMALHGQNYNTNMYKADGYAAKISTLNSQIASDPYDQELINRRNELLELQRESILAAEDEKNAIRDMVEDGIDLELDALQERIDKYNESIDAAKDLYDYQKNVQKQSEEIASLEKQRAAYMNDDSEESKAKLQEITVSLKEAKEDLKETEYERYISDQQTLLDNLYTEYELILNQRLDNVDALLEQVIESINIAASADGTIASSLGSEGAIAVALNNNATSIKSTLETEAKNVGATLSTSMNNIWSTGDGSVKSVLTMYGEDFRNRATTVNITLGGIKSSVDKMVSALNKEAEKKVSENKTTTSSKKNPNPSVAHKPATNKSTVTSTKTNNKTSSKDGKPKVGDKVKFVSGQYYYDSQGQKPLGSKNQGKYVYITKINEKGWATHPYHISTGTKLGKGDLGWLKLNQISGYATGKKNFLDDEVAWTQEGAKEFIVRPSDGAILTPIAKGDSVLTSAASSNIWNMANSPAEFIKDNLKLGAANVPNNSNVHSNYTQVLDKVVFNLPNVKSYDELISAMQKDKNFERLINSMTIDRIAGKSGLAKGKAIR